MKKIILSIISVAFAANLSAQTVNVHFKNGQTIQYPSDNVDYVDFSVKAPDPTVSAGAVVDLGLSVYWASCNLGAESPEDFGDYYAWGETKPKSSYSKDNYSYYDKDKAKYIDIGEDIAGTEYDAATVNLGSDWRMPTYTEMKELVDQCSWEWTQIKGINGYKITGTNGNSIFLPATSNYNSWLYYWTSNLQSNQYEEWTWLLVKQNGSYKVSGGIYSYVGCSIRPVTKNPNASGDPVDHSQDHLVTDKVSASFGGGSISSINGRIMAGSSFNVRFANNSSEAVTLISIQMYDQGNSNKGNNVLTSEVEVTAGETKAYNVSIGTSMLAPTVCFTYIYNKKKYIVEATWTN